MKRYVVMINYGCYEGWKISVETDRLPEVPKLILSALEQAGGMQVQAFETLESVLTVKGRRSSLKTLV